MTKINLYKIDNFKKVITKLLEAIIAQNKKVFCLVKNSQEESELDYLLWSYSQLSFIPHGTSQDPYPEEQKIIIGSKISFKLELLLITDYIKLSAVDIYQYEKILLVERYDLEGAKQFLTSLDCKVNYFEQDSEGKWIQIY